MTADATTFYFAFTAVFGLIALYLWRIDRRARALESRLDLLEAEAATEKNPNPPEEPRAP